MPSHPQLTKEALRTPLRAHRERTGKMLEQCCIDSGIGYSLLWSIETGKMSPTLDKIPAIAFGYGLTEDEAYHYLIEGRRIRGAVPPGPVHPNTASESGQAE